MASREDKVLFATIMIIYSEAVICGVLIPFIGFAIPLTIICTSIPFTLMGVKYYNLTLYKRLNEEVKGIPFWTGTMIDLNGVWMGVDIPIADKEEINVSDQEIADYQNSIQFKSTLDEMKQENEEFANIVDHPEEFNDTYVTGQEILRLYTPLGLVTSRQIYCFEMISAFYMIDRQKMAQSYQTINTLIATKDPNKDIAKDDIDALSPFDRILFGVLEIQFSAQSNKSKVISEYLESVLVKFGISDKIAYNNELYKSQTVALQYVEKIHKDPKEVRKNFLKNSFPLILSFISIMFSMFSIIYIRLAVFSYISEYNTVLPIHEMYISILTGLSFLPIVIGIIFVVRYLRKNKTEEAKPIELHFNNTVSHKTSFENFCELKRRIREYGSDSRLYKVFPTKDYRSRWRSEYFIAVLPASYEDSLQFDTGMVPHKGYAVTVNTTPIVMQNIGKMYNEVPIFLMVACTYHFKRFTKIFYNYNIRQNWLEKIFLQIIASLNAKMSIMSPNQQALSVAVKTWEEFAILQAQTQAYQQALRMNETIKTQRNESLHNPPEEESETESPELPPIIKKRPFMVVSIIAIILVIVCITLAILLIGK